jgi:LytS/YehU family sensor histidine kinase
MTENDVFLFEVKNNCNSDANKYNTEKGIGLENARKRLEAYYPDNKHSLSVSQADNNFTVELKINFSQST